jgi:hypothetical protein
MTKPSVPVRKPSDSDPIVTVLPLGIELGGAFPALHSPLQVLLDMSVIVVPE